MGPCLPKKQADRLTTDSHGILQRVKISSGKDEGYRLLPDRDTVPRRSLLKASPHNQQMLLGKSKNPDFEDQAYQGDRMAKGKIGDSAFLGEYKAKWKKEYHRQTKIQIFIKFNISLLL